MSRFGKIVLVIVSGLTGLLLLAGLGAQAPATAQTEDTVHWEFGLTGPTGYTRGAYDPLQSAAVVVSVIQGENQVWQYLPAGDQWTNLGLPGPAEPSPFPRDGYTMARHPISGDLLLFGGHVPDTCGRFYLEEIYDHFGNVASRPAYACEELNDLWRVDAATGNWEAIQLSGEAPEARAFAAMAAAVYDDADPDNGAENVVVLTGGYAEDPVPDSYSTPRVLSDTWELRYDATTGYSWVDRGTGAPAERFGHAMTFIPAHTLNNDTAVPPRLIMAGGVEAVDDEEELRSWRESYRYDRAAGTWISLPAPDDDAQADLMPGYGQALMGPALWHDAEDAVPGWRMGLWFDDNDLPYFGLYNEVDGWQDIYEGIGTAPTHLYLANHLPNRASIPLGNSVMRADRIAFPNQPLPQLLVGGQGHINYPQGWPLAYHLAHPRLMVNPIVSSTLEGDLGKTILLNGSGAFLPAECASYCSSENYLDDTDRAATWLDVRLDEQYVSRLAFTGLQGAYEPDFGHTWEPGTFAQWRASCLPPVRSWRYGGQGWEGGLDPFSGRSEIPVRAFDTALFAVEGVSRPLDNAVAHVPSAGAFLFGGTSSSAPDDPADCDGWESGALHNELWQTEDGLIWEPVSVSGESPPARRYGALVHWQQNGSDFLLLFGGEGASREPLDDTWIFDLEAGTWQEMTPATAPSPRHSAAAVFAAHAGEAWLFGGAGMAPDVWSWDGTTWHEDLTATEAEAYWNISSGLTYPVYTAYHPGQQRAFVMGKALLDTNRPLFWDGAAYSYGDYNPGPELIHGGNFATIASFGSADTPRFLVSGQAGLTFLLDPDGGAQPTATPTPSATPTATPTASPTPTTTPPPVSDEYRDFGDLRIWADSFSASGGVVEAVGNVLLGSAAADAPYTTLDTTISFPESPGPGDVATIASGSLALIGENLSLGSGAFTIGQSCLLDGDLADRLPVNGSDALAIDVTSLEARLCAGAEVQAGLYGQGALSLAFLPENNTASADLAFSLTLQNGDFLWSGDASAESSINLAGGLLTADLALDDDGLAASTATLTLPLYDATPIQLDDLRIDNGGNLTLGGATGEFTLPDLELGDPYGIAVRDITAQLEATTDAYELALTACVEVALPDSDLVSLSTDCTLALTVRDGVLADADLPDFSVAVAGLPMAFAAPALDSLASGEVQIVAGEVSWQMPAAWGAESMTLSNVAIANEAPYLELEGGAATIPIDQTFTLGGAGDQAGAHFSIDTLTLALEDVARAPANPAASATLRYSARLEGEVTLRIGREVVAGVTLILEDGSVRFETDLPNLTAELAGMALEMAGIHFEDGLFSVADATLTLPADWGGTGLSIPNLTIDENGVDLGGAGITLPDQDFGGVLKLTELNATLVGQASGLGPRQYRLDVSAAVEVVGDTAVSTSGTIRFYPDGRISGEVDAFSFSVVAFEMDVQGVRFSRDRLQASSVTMGIPPEFEALNARASATVMGLEIGADGIRILGGGFAFAFDVGATGVAGAANFGPDPNVPGGYIVTMDAAVTTPDMTLGGHVTIAVVEESVELRKILVTIEGTPPNAPTVLLEPITELYLYRVSGEMELTDARQAIAVSAAAESLYRVGPLSLLGADATLTGEWHPDHYILLEGKGYLLEQEVSSAALRIQPDSVVFSGTTGINSNEQIVIEQSFAAAIGYDGDGEPTMLAGAGARLFVAQGAIFPAVPPCDVEGEANGTIGRHLHDGQKVWGARVTGQVDVCFISKQGWVWVGFSPFAVDGGFGEASDTYLPIWPTARNLAMQEGAYVDPRVLAARAAPADAGPAPAATRTQGQFVAGPASSLLVVEYLPDGVGFDAPPLALTPPSGATFSPPADHASAEFRARYYVLDAPQQGVWGVEAPSGAYVAALGSDPAPVVEEASITDASAPYGFSWRVSDDDPLEDTAIWLQARRSDEPGQTVQIAEGLAATGQVTWSPARLASGEYVVELVVDTGLQTILHEVGAVIWEDTAPPAAPTDLQATVLADGSLLLDWQPADEDTAGYRVQVAGSAPLTRWGRHQNSYRTVGFSPGDTFTARVAAVDLSGNASPWREREVTFAAPDVAVQSWTPHGGATRVPGNTRAVTVTFRQPFTVTAFTVTGPSGALPGSWTPLTLADESSTPLTIGASWRQASVTCSPNPPGSYTAEVTGATAGGDSVTLAWSWSVATAELNLSSATFAGCRLLLPAIRQ